ncbi:helix-turn-helix domain-containing protein [Sinorhizobium meliloti]|uniref:helix-turn-helix domain-containing protein n=1 Tax=Rhizobium meliloti TaxID=382 RepID=UPI002278F22D|nr:helix-turn-helix transcriptional regulator [Sinorhizobium meliloti]
MSSSEGRQPSYIDVQVGSRIKMQRAVLGMSQTRLAEALGITFQQVQKYEKGINRVGASRLSRIAEVLGVSISFFFENSRPAGADTTPSGTGRDLVSFLSTPEGLELNRAFARIADARLRRQLASLVTAIATTDVLKAPGVGR